ncbi:DUF2061 domain-containing protein [Halomicrobium urmianum]|uniref:DUF2061 domain-containing protein n=1 Tax=Halomicrobium urmianum TaxID=1586233 RepID=UPI001CD9971E|nr:DUF2061 domain-containing protein [Halomicrobium urmianum]
MVLPSGLLDRQAIQRRRRAVVKTLLYRLVMVAITVAVALAVTGSAGDALEIGLAANVVKTVTYYSYERLWDRVSWGVAGS